MAHKSMAGFAASARSCFRRGLGLWIGLRDQRARFAQPEAQRAKQPLTLPCLEIHGKWLGDEPREALAIPQAAARHARLARTLA